MKKTSLKAFFKQTEKEYNGKEGRVRNPLYKFASQAYFINGLFYEVFSAVRAFCVMLSVASGVWTTYFVFGLCLGSPTVLIPQIRRDTTYNDTISVEMASWLSSIHGYSGAPGAIFISILALRLGRKIMFLTLSIGILGSFIAFYFSRSVLQIFISEIMLGFFVGSQLIISMFLATEYTSPRYRGVFLAIKGPSFYWGVWIANTIGTFFHWNIIGILGVICSLYTTAIIMYWPESPYWLASKKRFNECAVSHRWLKGCDEAAEEELKQLIAVEKEHIKNLRSNSNQKTKISTVVKIALSGEFGKSILLCMLLFLLFHLSGKIVCAVYAIDIIKNITNNEGSAYVGMLILDGITVFSLYIGCGLSKLLNRRTLLIISSSAAVVILFTMSFYLYVVKLNLIHENKYITLSLLSLYTISISIGPSVLCTTIYGELISLKYRCWSMIIITIFGNICMATLLKLGPLIFKTLKIHGTFLFYGVSSFVCIIVIYKYLPETKDKTLQEIQDCLNSNLKNKEEIVELI